MIEVNPLESLRVGIALGKPFRGSRSRRVGFDWLSQREPMIEVNPLESLRVGIALGKPQGIT
jgi:hypothetical protein